MKFITNLLFGISGFLIAIVVILLVAGNQIQDQAVSTLVTMNDMGIDVKSGMESFKTGLDNFIMGGAIFMGSILAILIGREIYAMYK